MDITTQAPMKTYAVNENRGMMILAMRKFAVVNAPPGSRDAPGNMLDGIKLKETFEKLNFRVSFDQKGEFTRAEAEAAVKNFVERLDSNVDMVTIAVISHGDFNEGGQVIEFSDGSKMTLGKGLNT